MAARKTVLIVDDSAALLDALSGAFEEAVREQSPVAVGFAEPRLSMPGGDALLACRLGGIPLTQDLVASLAANGLGPDLVDDQELPGDPA